MKEGPDIARIAALIGDPARANIMLALMSGKALTASELSQEAGVTLQTTSSHLAKLADGGLLAIRRQGRHKYFSFADDGVADLIESLMGVAAGSGHLRTRTGPRDTALRKARVCYNHLAGDMGVRAFDSLLGREFLAGEGDRLELTDAGAAFVTGFGVDLAPLRSGRAVLCKRCLDWSERRSHLAGSLGRALLSRVVELKWARREAASRAVTFTAQGERAFLQAFPLREADPR